jgi:hypothetical protein
MMRRFRDYKHDLPKWTMPKEIALSPRQVAQFTGMISSPIRRRLRLRP